MTIELGILLAIVGGFVGLAGWLGGRDKRISSDAEWRGLVTAKLDEIIEMNKQINALCILTNNHETRITVLEKEKK